MRKAAENSPSSTRAAWSSRIEVAEFIVKRTDGVSAAFIKELMRRSAQSMLHAGAKQLTSDHIREALEELLFTGGSLNAKLLGAACNLKP